MSSGPNPSPVRLNFIGVLTQDPKYPEFSEKMIITNNMLCPLSKLAVIIKYGLNNQNFRSLLVLRSPLYPWNKNPKPLLGKKLSLPPTYLLNNSLSGNLSAKFFGHKLDIYQKDINCRECANLLIE